MILPVRFMVFLSLCPEASQNEPWDDEVSAGEALYDEPILKPMVSKDSHFLEPLFDDPGYNKGLGLAGQDSSSTGDTKHTYNTLEEVTREGQGEEEEGEVSIAAGIGEQMAATKPEMKDSVHSLEMLRLLDEELKLDELISSLMQQDDI